MPRTPIVFNELGNGSGADNDWLELRNVTDAAVSLKDWELSVVADAKQEDTSLVVFPGCECAGEWLVVAHEHALGQDPSSPAAMTLRRQRVAAIREGKA